MGSITESDLESGIATTIDDDVDETLDPDTLAEALREANIPVLIAVLAHLTGDDRWLRDPFRPTRTRGLSEHGTGGLPDDVQDQVRRAVHDLLTRDAGSFDPPDIDDERLTRIMSNCMGESVPADYASMMREEMGLRPRFAPRRLRTLNTSENYSVLIIGAGASGLCMAAQLRQAGIEFSIIEKNPGLGGTWHENRYPDCGVDTPSYWYSYSFYPTNWSRFYSRRDDVHDYFGRVTDAFGLRDHILFDTHAKSATYDERNDIWTVRAVHKDGSTKTLRARFIVTAVGQLNQPKTPGVPGADEFRGLQFHSARWPKDCDISGKKVAVVGTGASAMQLVPAIAGQVAELTIFQRSPQWVAPNEEYDRVVSDNVRYLMRHVPYYAAWYRMRQVWVFGDKIHQNLVIDPEWQDNASAVNAINDGYRRYFTKYIEEQLSGRADLVKKAVPDYPPFGKRMLLDNGWFATLREPHVRLVTDRIDHIEPTTIHTRDGESYEADVIIYATGFDSLNMLGSVDIHGREGIRVRDRWGSDDARAFLGMTERGFPNLFFLYGPNTNLGHGGSLLFITECQVRYILDLMAQMIEQGATRIECRQDLRDEHNDAIDEAHRQLIWSHPGMDTWYRNARGRVVTNSPWTLLDLWKMMRHADLEHYELGVPEPQD